MHAATKTSSSSLRARGSQAQTNWVNRRDTDRLDVELSITVESESNFFAGFSENISEGGIFIATHDYKPMGTRVAVQFSLPDMGPAIHVTCEVRWVREYNPLVPDMIPGMGLCFEGLTEQDQRRIQHFCQQLREPLFMDMDMEF